MLNPRMLELVRHRLLTNGPQRPGGHDYVTGIDDAIAAVGRLIEAETTGGPPTTTWTPDDPEPTRLAQEYLQLELTSLVSMINATLRRLSPSQPVDTGTSASLCEAREHVIRARASLGQDRGREPA